MDKAQKVKCLTTLALLFCTSLSAPTVNAAQSTSAASPRPPIIDAKSQALLDKTIQALGGTDFLNFKTLTTRGRVFLFYRGESAGFAKFVSDVEYPDKRRFSYGSDKPVTVINDGDNGWEVDQLGVARQKDEQIRRWKLANRYSLENLLRLRLHDPGILVQDAGVDFVDEFPARVLTITDAKGTRIKLYVRSTTFVPLRVTYSVLDPKTHDWDEYTDIYSDYRMVENILTPMHIAHLENGDRVSEIFRNTAEYDKTYPAGTFQPPE